MLPRLGIGTSTCHWICREWPEEAAVLTCRGKVGVFHRLWSHYGPQLQLAWPSVFTSSSCVLFTDGCPEAAGAVCTVHGPLERRGGGTELICHWGRFSCSLHHVHYKDVSLHPCLFTKSCSSECCQRGNDIYMTIKIESFGCVEWTEMFAELICNSQIPISTEFFLGT